MELFITSSQINSSSLKRSCKDSANTIDLDSLVDLENDEFSLLCCKSKKEKKKFEDVTKG